MGPGVVSAQDYDTAVASADVADATQRAAADERGYEVLRAPFDGTVTARYADPGALMQSATSAQTSALPVVTVSQVDRLRVYAYLDQRDATFIREGEEADITLAERPGAHFPGTVTRLSHQLDPKTRTMLVEVDLDDKDGRIIPGSFVRVTLKIPVPSLVQVPSAALVLRGTAPFVVVVGADNHIHFASVKLADDDGKTARVIDGLQGGERLALNLGEDVAEGGLVQPLAEEGASVAPRTSWAQGLLAVVAVGLATPALGGSEPASIPVLSFDDAVARTLAKNPTVAIAAQETKRAVALVEQVRAASLPTLGATAEGIFLDAPRTEPPSVPVAPGNANLAEPQNQVVLGRR